MTTPRRSLIDQIIRRPYTVELRYGDTPEEGVLASVAEWPGCMTAGDTPAEALERLELAMRDWASAQLDTHGEVPDPVERYGGSILVRVAKSLHRDVAHRAARDGVSLNQWIVTTLSRAVGEQGYFWTEAWQRGEREATADIRAGRTKRTRSAKALVTDLKR